MIGLFINIGAVILGGILGALFGKKMTSEFTGNMNKVFGICAMCMGISTISGMRNMPAVVLAVVLGTAIGLVCKLGDLFTKGGMLLQKPVSKLMGNYSGGKDMTQEEYLSLLLTTVVLFCSSSTGIYGCLDAGMTGSSTILVSKAVLDLFTAMVFACNLGAVVAVVAVPQFIVYMIMFLAAKLIFPLTTPDMIGGFKACGGFLLVATGCRVAKMQEFPIADMLPAMVLVMPLSSLWSNVIAPLLG